MRPINLTYRTAFRGVTLVVLLALLAMAFTSQHLAYGQGDGILAWIVNSVPAVGEELAVNQGVTITFNTPMNRASVESAFSVSPAAPGAFQWKDDTSFTFTPTTSFYRDTAYIFQIDSGAKSSEGSGLRDTISLKLHTTGYLEVTQFFPENEGANFELQPMITIVFNRPVVPISTAAEMQKMAAPFVSDPPMNGVGEWLTSSIYSFKPTKLLQNDTEYTITIKKMLTDVSGSTPKDDIVFKFKTVSVPAPTSDALSIQYLSPGDNKSKVGRNPVIKVGFAGTPDRASAEAGFSLIGPNGKVLTGKFEWKDKVDELRFRADDLLDYSSQYTIQLDAAKIRTKTGIGLFPARTTQTFTTVDKPQIISTTPADGSLVSPSTVLTLNFTTLMKLDDFANHIQVQPKTPVMVLDSQDMSSVRVQFSTLPSTTYKWCHKINCGGRWVYSSARWGRNREIRTASERLTCTLPKTSDQAVDSSNGNSVMHCQINGAFSSLIATKNF